MYKVWKFLIRRSEYVIKYCHFTVLRFKYNETNDILSKDIEPTKLSIPQQKQKSVLLSTNAAI